MRELSTKYLRLLKKPALFALGLFILILVFLPGAVAAKKNVIQKITIQSNPLSVQFFVTGKVPVKVIQIEEREVLVALKDVVLSPGLKVLGRKNPAIEHISIQTLDGDVVAVVVTGKLPFGRIRSGFNKSDTRFSLSFDKTSASTVSKSVVKVAPKANPGKLVKETKKEAKKEAKKEDSEIGPVPKARPESQVLSNPKPETKGVVLSREKKNDDLSPPVYTPPPRVKGEYKGNISDLCLVIEGIGCESNQIEKAIFLIKKQSHGKAFDLLDQSLSMGNSSCLEQVQYLRAYSYAKSVAKEDYIGLLAAEKLFQDVLVSFPRSSQVPYAYTSIAMINLALKNNAAAEGYLNIVRQGYPDYSGMPEVLYYLADIYTGKGYHGVAMGYYKQVFESPIENTYIADAGVGYGKALFKKRQYFDALSVFNYVVNLNDKKVYESPDLLLNMANANFELGLNTQARQHFMRVLNLFPGIPDRDVVLSNVGDAYGIEDNSGKAIKIYELVREMFPDSQGYVNASIGIARYLKTDPEKIEIYEMIKTRFPDNTYARIAMMRLAEIYQKNKEYNKCITEIEDLLSTHPRGLRYEAVKLMQQAYEALFKQQLKADEYTSILNRYELEHTKIDKMGSREISFHVGVAYLKANLYEQAFNHLINAYKQYKRSRRSPELLFGLGLAMDESGRDEDALKLFAAFSKRFPKNKYRVEALTRMGEIYLEKKLFAKSAGKFKQAYLVSGNSLEKGKILIRKSNIYEQQNDLTTASKLLAQAVKDLAAAPGKNYDTMTDAYKKLGNTYLRLTSYIQAADAFSMALNFSEGNREKANLGFLLGDAYQKGNIIQKAKEAFEQVTGNYDSVWARLARQRLTTLELAETVINS